MILKHLSKFSPEQFKNSVEKPWVYDENKAVINALNDWLQS